LGEGRLWVDPYMLERPTDKRQDAPRAMLLDLKNSKVLQNFPDTSTTACSVTLSTYTYRLPRKSCNCWIATSESKSTRPNEWLRATHPQVTHAGFAAFLLTQNRSAPTLTENGALGPVMCYRLRETIAQRYRFRNSLTRHRFACGWAFPVTSSQRKKRHPVCRREVGAPLSEAKFLQG